MIKEEFTKEEITEALLNIRSNKDHIQEVADNIQELAHSLDYFAGRLYRRLNEVNRLVLDEEEE